jgi:hypothetical protein
MLNVVEPLPAPYAVPRAANAAEYVERETAAPSAFIHPDGAEDPTYQTTEPAGIVEPTGIVVVGAAVVVVAAIVVGAAVVPAEYAPPGGGPDIALSASHEDPAHDAAHTRGAVVSEIIPNTPRVEDNAEATYTTPALVLTTMSFAVAENTSGPVSD